MWGANGNRLPRSSLTPGVSAWALQPLPAPREGKGAITVLWGDKTSGEDRIIFGRLSQKPPNNKPLVLPGGERCGAGARGGRAEAGVGREWSLGAPVLRGGMAMGVRSLKEWG